MAWSRKVFSIWSHFHENCLWNLVPQFFTLAGAVKLRVVWKYLLRLKPPLCTYTLLNILDEKWRSSEIIYGTIEETLALFRMHVNCYDMIETSFGQHLSHQFQGNIASSPHLGYKQKSRNNNILLLQLTRFDMRKVFSLCSVSYLISHL